MSLIDHLIEERYLKTPRIIEAFRAIDRADFVPDDMKSEVEINAPLPIGHGQTISQPLTVAFMLELLAPMPGNNVLDIGYGSGWTTALLAYIVSKNQTTGNSKQATGGDTGKVFAIERIPELADFGRKNVTKYNFIEKGIVEMKYGDGTKGWPELASRPELVEGFDRIHAAASAREIPRAWKEQLKIGGRLVTPVGGSIWLLVKKSDHKFEEKEFPGFAFVPLIEE